MLLNRYLSLLYIICFINYTSSESITKKIQNNNVTKSSIGFNSHKYYYFSVSATDKIFKKAVPTIYVSITICSQPLDSINYRNSSLPLNLRISTSSEDLLADISNRSKAKTTENGYASWISDNTTSEVWISVSSPNAEYLWSGNWTYEIGVSTSQAMHDLYTNNEANNDFGIPYMALEDTDQNSALFTSSPYLNKILNSTMLMTKDLPLGLSNSYCAAQQYKAQDYNVNTSLTHRGLTAEAKQQFVVSNLEQNTVYRAFMVQFSENSIKMTKFISLKTKTTNNCRLIYDLPFCNQVAYSVPVNSSTGTQDDMSAIASQYDIQASQKFNSFNLSLSQFNCNATQYSLIRNCDDCYNSYKNWLCSVTIPRCTDSSSSINLGQNGITHEIVAPSIRENVNSSRNGWIEDTIQPGRWTELLPCIDLCYYVVQSCPPFLQFHCPNGESVKLQYGYWKNSTVAASDDQHEFGINNPTCNRLGVAPYKLTISYAHRILKVPLIQITLMFILLTITLL